MNRSLGQKIITDRFGSGPAVAESASWLLATDVRSRVVCECVVPAKKSPSEVSLERLLRSQKQSLPGATVRRSVEPSCKSPMAALRSRTGAPRYQPFAGLGLKLDGKVKRSIAGVAQQAGPEGRL